MKHLRLVVLTLAALPLLAVAGVAFAGGGASVKDATQATSEFHDLDKAKAAGYTVQVFDAAGITCIASSDGAMGIHMLNPSLLDSTVDAAAPELLVYEPRNNGTLKLVAHEYLVFQSAWTGSDPPELFGREFDFVPSPNRYGLPPFYALHAWVWKPNPSGLLNAWNPDVSCD
jgi:hypothetical protein